MQVYLPTSEEGGTRHTIEMYAWGADAREAFQRSGYTMFSDGQVLIDGKRGRPQREGKRTVAFFFQGAGEGAAARFSGERRPTQPRPTVYPPLFFPGRVTFGSHEEMTTQASRATEALRLKDKQKKIHMGTEILPLHVDQWLQVRSETESMVATNDGHALAGTFIPSRTRKK
jgi:hypothetical protein